MPEPSRFEDALRAVQGVEGWLTDAQARMLWDAARELGAGARVVEIGSYHGRSAIVLARALAGGGEVVAIDPHAGNDRGPQEWEGPAAAGQADHERFLGNLARAGVRERVRHVREPSRAALGAVEGPIDLLYVDGSHRYREALPDIRDWGSRLGPEGLLLIHDSFSSVGVTLALLRQLVFGGDFTYEGRVGSLARYRRTTLAGRCRLRNAARQLAELGWFARNVLVKLALVTKLHPLARALGQRDLSWPY